MAPAGPKVRPSPTAVELESRLASNAVLARRDGSIEDRADRVRLRDDGIGSSGTTEQRQPSTRGDDDLCRAAGAAEGDERAEPIFVALGPFDQVVVSATHLLLGMWFDAAIGYGDVLRNIGLAASGNLVGGLLFVTLSLAARAKGGRVGGTA